MAVKKTRAKTKTEAEAKTVTKRPKYIYAKGRRKTATAKVKLYPEGQGQFRINDRELGQYFGTLKHRNAAATPLAALGMEKQVDVEVRVAGGGLTGQAEAVRLGLARALVKHDPDSKTTLKKFGYLTRDARKKERKKPGLKRARRAPQWQKR